MVNYFGLAYQFFNLTREAINEMINQGNHTMTISDPQITPENSWKLYDFNTRWNDFNIGVPILFNFYHGLELFMKGILNDFGGDQNIPSHKLTKLFLEIKKMEPKVPEPILEILNTHLTEKSPFNDFFKTNGGSVDGYYELLKYPESKKGSEFSFYDIRGMERKGIKRFKEIRKATLELKDEIVNWNKQLKNGA